MFSVFSFIFTFSQLAIILTSYALQAKITFNLWVIYGSPFYMIRNALGSESVVFDSNPLYLVLAVYHVIKYLIMFKAQRDAEKPGMFYTAVAFETFYLCLSGYYMN